MLKNEIRETEGQIVELSERRKRILRTVVESYIATAEPIGSKAIAEQAGLTCSSATIRNELRSWVCWSSPTPPPDGSPLLPATASTSTN